MSAGTVQVQLAPLVRAEALYLLGGVRMGQVVCAELGLTVHRPGFHLLAGTAVQVTDPPERNHYLCTLPAFANGANRIWRIRPRLVSGQRFQRLTAPSDTL